MRTVLRRIGPLLAAAAAVIIGSGAAALAADHRAAPADRMIGMSAASSSRTLIATGTIYDNAATLDSSEVRQVNAAIKQLPSSVKVIVVTARVGTGNLVDYLKNNMGSKVGWNGSTFAHDTVVVAVATDIRQMDIYYGSDLIRTLDPAQDQVFSAMGAKFRDADWGGGLVAGITTIGQALDGTLPAPDPGNDYPGATKKRSNAGWWVAGGLGVAGLGYAGGKNLLRNRRQKQAEAAEKARLDRLSGENLNRVAELRARLDQDQLLVPSIPDSPLQDQLEMDLKAADADLNTAALETSPEQGAKELEKVSAAVESLDRRVALLRKATGWELAWTDEVQQSRDRSAELGRLTARIAAFPAAAAPAPDVTTTLYALEADVRDGRKSIETGLGELMTIARDLNARVYHAEQQLSSLDEAREAEQRRQAQRQREVQTQEYQDSYRGGGGGSGWLGYWVGSSMNRRGGGWGGGGWGGGRGGGWGGGRGGGGWGGGSRSSGSRGSGSGWSRGGGGSFSRGGGSGGGSRGF